MCMNLQLLPTDFDGVGLGQTPAINISIKKRKEKIKIKRGKKKIIKSFHSQLCFASQL